MMKESGPVNFIDDVIQKFPFSQEAVIAIDPDGRRETHHFSHLFARSMGLSGAMLEQGVRRGDVVMILTGSRIEFVISMLACFRMGAVALPMNPQLTAADLAFRVSATNPSLAIGESRYLENLGSGVPALDMDDLARIFDEDLDQATPAKTAKLDPGDPALIVFTSGSTGEPKGVIHPQSYLLGQSTQAEHWLGAAPGDLVWCTAAPGCPRAIPSSPRGCAGQRPSSWTDASIPPPGSRSPGARASTCSARPRPSTGSWPSGPTWSRSRACGAWSPPVRP